MSLISANSPGPCDEPKEIVKKYSTADLAGYRLSGKTWKNIAPLITWEDEPGWDSAILSKKVYIHDIKTLGPDSVAVEVYYENIGMWAGLDFIPFELTEVVNFKLVKKNGKWLISSPVIPPHVLPKIIISLLAESRTEEKNPEYSERLGRAIEGINELSKYGDSERRTRNSICRVGTASPCPPKPL